MLSFTELTKDNRESVTELFKLQLDADSIAAFREITDGILDSDELEYAVALDNGCLLIRVFDMGKYIFIYPYEIMENADIHSAILQICEYAVREELPLVFSDVPADALSEFSVFRHMDIDAEDIIGESFSVKIKTECMLLDEIPIIDMGRVKLSAIEKADIPLYAKLSKAENVNKYWGYDYKNDVSVPTDEYFYETAMRDFSYGTAISLAIRCEGAFCGEAVLYAFDGMGCAEFAIRLLPKWQGKGLGRCTVKALSELARKIGLVRLSSVIMKENKKSLSMLDSATDIKEDHGDSVRYTIEIT